MQWYNQKKFCKMNIDLLCVPAMLIFILYIQFITSNRIAAAGIFRESNDTSRNIKAAKIRYKCGEQDYKKGIDTFCSEDGSKKFIGDHCYWIANEDDDPSCQPAELKTDFFTNKAVKIFANSHPLKGKQGNNDFLIGDVDKSLYYDEDKWEKGHPIKGKPRVAIGSSGKLKSVPEDYKANTICQKTPPEEKLRHLGIQKHPYRISMVPNKGTYAIGERFKVVCTAFIVDPSTIDVVFNKGWKKFQIEEKDVTYKTYHEYEGNCHSDCSKPDMYVCKRRTTFEAHLYMKLKYDGSSFFCCFHGWKESGSRCVMNQMILRKRYSLKPELKVIPNNMKLKFGETLICNCTCKLGAGRYGTLALRTVGSVAKCNYWPFLLDYTRNDVIPSWNKTRCPENLASIKESRFKDSTWDGGNMIIAEMVVKGEGRVHGARCFCFSYNATSIHDGNNGRNTDISTMSAKIEIQYLGGPPKLEVKWHATPSVVHGNNWLIADCTSQVPTGGSLVWALATKDGNVVRISSKYGKKPEGVPQGITVDNFPMNKSCQSEKMIGDAGSQTCVYLSSKKHIWELARGACMQIGHKLVTITNAVMNEAVFQVVEHGGFWISLNSAQTQALNKGCRSGDKKIYSNWGVGPYACAFNAHNVFGDGSPCVLINGTLPGKWYLGDCNSQHRYVCQTKKGDYLLEDFFDSIKGPQIKSTISILINKSHDDATLDCYTNPSHSMFKPHNGDKSAQFKFKFGPGKPKKLFDKKEVGGKTQVIFSCDAPVGEEGTMTWVLYRKKSFLFRCYIDLSKSIDCDGKGWSNLMFKEIEVLSDEVKGPQLSVHGTITETETFSLRDASIKCFPHKATQNELIDLTNATKIHVQKAKAKISVKKSSNLALYIPYVVISIIALLLCITCGPLVACLNWSENNCFKGDNNSGTYRRRTAYAKAGAFKTVTIKMEKVASYEDSLQDDKSSLSHSVSSTDADIESITQSIMTDADTTNI